MIRNIVKHNIDNRILDEVAKAMSIGKIIAYPTDTSWAVGCSASSKEGINKLRKLKGDFKQYTPTLICSKISQISSVAELTNNNFKIIKRYTPGPYVFILPALNIIKKRVNMKRIEIGVRIPSNPVPIAIVNWLDSPIFSITASKKMGSHDWWTPEYAEDNLYEYGWELEEIKEISIILDTGERLIKNLSTVIDLKEGQIDIIRHGIGKI